MELRGKARPACASLLDSKVRSALGLYSTLGYVGFAISEALAYIELIEAELARHEEAHRA